MLFKFFVLIVVVVFVEVAIYTWLLPNYFPDFKSYVFFFIGLIISFVAVGYFCFQEFATESLVFRIGVSVLCILISGIVESLLIIGLIIKLIGS